MIVTIKAHVLFTVYVRFVLVHVQIFSHSISFLLPVNMTTIYATSNIYGIYELTLEGQTSKLNSYRCAVPLAVNSSRHWWFIIKVVN